ncbi:hypothetical protein AOQ71_26740 [Bradyrhizobium manausense]|uniref:Uncharacterized protein n=1 Tax=Bradyrhizobium manausense TaxID=989370 RepID=A0A0R3D845_9BRAD|nr:hypothetical protein AOQ71_26740 [Bradyrhizobium manausense]
MRFVLARLFQENISQLSIRQKLRLRAGFARSLGEPFAQRLLLPYSSSDLAHLFRNAGQALAFPGHRICSAGTPASPTR